MFFKYKFDLYCNKLYFNLTQSIGVCLCLYVESNCKVAHKLLLILYQVPHCVGRSSCCSRPCSRRPCSD